MTRDELEAEIQACAAEFRAARGLVDQTERRLSRAFERAGDDDQLWYVARVMETLGVLIQETQARGTEMGALATAMASGIRVH